MTARIAIRRASCLALLACLALPAGAPAAESTASIALSFSPNRLGASASLELSLQFGGGSFDIPAPLSRVVVRLPAGLRVNVHGIATCSKPRLVAHGPKGCPAAARIGSGHALLGAHLGSQTITEKASLTAFRVPSKGGHPTLMLSGQGLTPLDVRVVTVGVLEPDSAPYGLQLVMPVPAIPTLPTEPNASMLKLSLTIGGSGRARKLISVPRSCPAQGFPFAGQIAFADGTSGEATVAVGCP
jgi:hypothetical protein